MTALVLIAIVVMWLVVLVPMWLKRHDEVEETRSVDKFTSAMHTLSRREAAEDHGDSLISHRKRSLDVHVSGASVDGQKVRIPRRKPEPARSRRKSGAAVRRRRALLGLAAAAVVLAAGAVYRGGMVLWALQILADVVLVGFVVHLRTQAKNRAAAARRARRRVARTEGRRRVPSESRLRRESIARRDTAVSDEVYVDDQLDAEAQPDEVYVDEAYVDDRRHSARVGSEPVYAPTDEAFDQAAPVVTVRHFERSRPAPAAAPAPAPAAAAAASAQSPSRRRRISFDDPEVAADDAGQWDPVPVPRPVYTTKPPAPPRRRRAPLTEPLLPPAETVAEMDNGAELEEILDRRWAVND